MKESRIIVDPVSGQKYEVSVSKTDKGEIYSQSAISLEEEADRVGATSCEVVTKKNAFFLNHNPYYIGPSLRGKTGAEIMAVADQLKVNLSITDAKLKEAQTKNEPLKWVSCLFLPEGVETFHLPFKKA